MKVIRFNYNYGRAELCLPRVRELPGLEEWVEIQGVVNFEVRGIEGILNGNRFMISQVIGDIFVVVDGVNFKFLKSELVHEIKVEEIKVPETVITPSSPIVETVKEAVKEDLVNYIDTKFKDEGLHGVVEEKATEILEELVADATEDDIRSIFSRPIINNDEGK